MSDEDEDETGYPAPDLDQLEQDAEPASPELEDILAELQVLTDQRRLWTSKFGRNKIRYERLRQRADALLAGQGNRYFVGHDGVKYYSVRKPSSTILIDQEELRQAVSQAVYEEVFPRTFSLAAFKQAVATERITPAVYDKVVEGLKPRATVIDFVPADRPDD